MNEISQEITEKMEAEKKLSKNVSAFPTATNRTEAWSGVANLYHIYAMLSMSMVGRNIYRMNTVTQSPTVTQITTCLSFGLL